MFIAVLFTIALKQNNPYVHQLINKKIKMVYLYKKYYSAAEKGWGSDTCHNMDNS